MRALPKTSEVVIVGAGPAGLALGCDPRPRGPCGNADGMHRLVCARSGIGFRGGAHEETFVLADARMSWPGPALAPVVRGGALESRRDGYERSRRPGAGRVVTFTDRVTRAATLRGHRVRMVRNAAIALGGRIPAVQRRLAVERAELSPR